MEQFKNAILTIIPDSFQTPFDFDTPIDCCNKKLGKCLKRTRNFLEELRRNSEETPQNNFFDKRAVFSIGGGSSIYHRKCFVKELLLQFFPYNFESICLDLSSWSKVGEKDGINFDENFLKQLISETLVSYLKYFTLFYLFLICLPSDILRIVEGPFDPSQVLFLFKQGIDLFDSSYPTLLAEKGFAFNLSNGFPFDQEQFSLIDLNEKRFLHLINSI